MLIFAIVDAIWFPPGGWALAGAGCGHAAGRAALLLEQGRLDWLRRGGVVVGGEGVPPVEDHVAHGFEFSGGAGEFVVGTTSKADSAWSDPWAQFSNNL
jgi:hypothetical protein